MYERDAYPYYGGFCREFSWKNKRIIILDAVAFSKINLLPKHDVVHMNLGGV